MSMETISITALRHCLPTITKKKNSSYILTYHSKPIGTIFLAQEQSNDLSLLMKECDRSRKDCDNGHFVTSAEMKKNLGLLS